MRSTWAWALLGASACAPASSGTSQGLDSRDTVGTPDGGDASDLESSAERGSLNVKWNHASTATCESRRVVSLTARASRSGVLKAEASSPCSAAERGGTIPLEDLDPGTYRIEVEAFDANDKGTYIGVLESQEVVESRTVDTSPITLSVKPIFLNVQWTVPGGGSCVVSGIEEVKIEVIFDSGGSADVVGTQRAACDASVKDPRDATKTLAGVVFSELAPDDDVSIVATGYNEDDEAIARKLVSELVFAQGDEVTQLLALEACAGVCE